MSNLEKSQPTYEVMPDAAISQTEVGSLRIIGDNRHIALKGIVQTLKFNKSKLIDVSRLERRLSNEE